MSSSNSSINSYLIWKWHILDLCMINNNNNNNNILRVNIKDNDFSNINKKDHNSHKNLIRNPKTLM